jgi:enoyl-CoA hydratase/carnithine racemase
MALVEYNEYAPGCGLITLNDPSNLNAMGEDMAAEFKALVHLLKPNAQSLRCIIITGAGRAFSAGGNLEMLEKKIQLSSEENYKRMRNFYDSFLSILELNIPLIAAVNGHAVGAGLCVATACDVRIAAEGAKFGVTFTRLGLHPGMGGTYFLPKVLGYAAAAELMLTGRVIDAAEALRIGLVSKVEKAENLLGQAKLIAAEIAQCGPLANHQLVESLRKSPDSLETALGREASCQSINYASSQFKEGVRAAIEKRPANFS